MWHNHIKPRLAMLGLGLMFMTVGFISPIFMMKAFLESVIYRSNLVKNRRVS